MPFLVSFATNNTDGLGYQYKWNFGNGNTSTTSKQNITYQTAGNYNVQLIVTNKNGCKDTATTLVGGNKRPTASADYVRTGDRIYVQEDTVQFINNSVGGNRYIWDVIGIKIDTAFETASSFATPGKYRIKLAAKDTLTGCEDSTFLTIDVRVREHVHVPNAFTPNGDGESDYFFPRSLLSRGVTAFDMTIFNRWGEKVFFTNSTNGRGWDGNMSGKAQPTGVYIYQINVTYRDGNTEKYTGNVTLLR